MKQENTNLQELFAQTFAEMRELERQAYAWLDQSCESGHFDLIPEDELRFFGTVPNEDTLQKLARANDLLRIIALCPFYRVETFDTPNPHCESGIVALNATHGDLIDFSSSLLTAYRELLAIADEVTILRRDGENMRIAFSFNDLWQESRLSFMIPL